MAVLSLETGKPEEPFAGNEEIKGNVLDLETGLPIDVSQEQPVQQDIDPNIMANSPVFQRKQALEQLAAEQGPLDALAIATGKGMANIGRGAERLIASLAGDTEGQKELAERAKQAQAQFAPLAERFPVATTVGEVVGETAALPVGGLGGSLGVRAATSVGTGAIAGGLSEAGRGSDAGDITTTATLGAALGPVGEAVGELASRQGPKVAAGVKRLFASRTDDALPPTFFDANGAPTQEALKAIDALNITPDEFKSAFSDTAEGVVTPKAAGLTPEQAFRQQEAAQEGVRITQGQTSRDFAEQEAEDTLRSLSTPEGSQARQVFDEQQTQLIEAKNRFITNLGDAIDVSRTQRGADLQATVRDLNAAAKENVNALYSRIGQLPGGEQPISMDSIVDIESSLARELVPDDRMMKAVQNIFEDFSELEGDTVASKLHQGQLTFKNAEKFRQRLNKLKPSDNRDIAYVSALKQEFDKTLTGASEMFPDGSDISRAAKEARAAAANRFDTFEAKDIIQQLKDFKSGTRTDNIADSIVMDKLFVGSNQKVENIKLVRELLLKNGNQQTRQQWKSIQTQGAMDIFGKAVTETPDGFFISGAKLNTALKNFGEDGLKELFTPDQLRNMRRLQRVIGNSTIPVPRTTNPSGTGKRLINAAARLFSTMSGGFSDKAAALAGAAFGSVKQVAEREAVLAGIRKGATPQQMSNTVIRLFASPLAQRAGVESQREQ